MAKKKYDKCGLCGAKGVDLRPTEVVTKVEDAFKTLVVQACSACAEPVDPLLNEIACAKCGVDENDEFKSPPVKDFGEYDTTGWVEREMGWLCPDHATEQTKEDTKDEAEGVESGAGTLGKVVAAAAGLEGEEAAKTQQQLDAEAFQREVDRQVAAMNQFDGNITVAVRDFAMAMGCDTDPDDLEAFTAAVRSSFDQFFLGIDE